MTAPLARAAARATCAEWRGARPPSCPIFPRPRPGWAFRWVRLVSLRGTRRRRQHHPGVPPEGYVAATAEDVGHIADGQR